MSETTTLAVSKQFAENLREDYDGRNDMERLHQWAEEQFGYNDSITNEDLMEAIQDIEAESYNDSIDIDEIRDVVESKLKSNLSRQALDEY